MKFQLFSLCFNRIAVDITMKIVFLSLLSINLSSCMNAKDPSTPSKPLLGKKQVQKSKLQGGLSQFISGNENTQRDSSNPTLIPINGFIKVEAVAVQNSSILRSRLEALGMKNISVYQRHISGNFPVDSLTKASTLTELLLMRPVSSSTH